MYAMKPIIDSSAVLQGRLAHSMYAVRKQQKAAAANEAFAAANPDQPSLTIQTVDSQIAHFIKKNVVVNPVDQIVARQAKLLATLKELHHKLQSMQTILTNGPVTPTDHPNQATSAAAPAAAAAAKPTGEPFFVQQQLHRQRFNVTATAANALATSQVGGDIVINADPQTFLPYALRVLKSLWQDRCELRVQVYRHSSCTEPITDAVAAFEKILAYTRPLTVPADQVAVLPVTLIWKRCAEPELLCEAAAFEPIRGEANIIRFLYRCGPAELQLPEYRLSDWFAVDAALDLAHELATKGSTVAQRKRTWQQLSALLQKREYFGGELLSAADVAVASVARQVKYVLKSDDALPNNLVALANRVYELSEHKPW